ncbi:MAG TPA: hypothetical protein VJ836_03345 [Candidatus Saccharimonadales bacterium]|nr:hypothetical protein [Candidatus Saccharimonadales bacterium]
MTQFLSQALGAREPTFSQEIRQLEQAAGLPGTDIRLTADIMRRTRDKIAELGLDPNDTTGAELYRALQERLKADETKVRQALDIRHTAAPDDMLMRVQQFLDRHNVPRQCFALKASAAKRLLKKRPPKNAMKRLGYRSVDSMLKHEQVANLYAAALIAEPATWHKQFREQYTRLTPGDFETRAITLTYPHSKKWHELSVQFVHDAKHNIVSFRELGAVVLLPIAAPVDGLAITTLLLVLEEMNGLRAHSSYAKLQQVKPDFGRLMRQSSTQEPYTSAKLAGRAVPWRMIQQYYARFTAVYHTDIFEPHIQADDLHWVAGSHVLAELEPTLAFWQGSECLGFVDNGVIVSCNALDVALSYCNHLSFGERIVHFVRDSLWHELMIHYLHQDNLETALRQQLSAELTGNPPLAFAEQESYNKT